MNHTIKHPVMETNNNLVAMCTWSIKQYNDRLRQLFSRYNSTVDSILRLETTLESQRELDVFRLQKIYLRAHINRVLRS